MPASLINTAGAALGAFLTDTTLVPLWGLRSSQLLAVLMNLVAGLGALRLSTSRSEPEATRPAAFGPPTSEPSDGSWRRTLLVAVAILLSGFVATAMEMVWFRHLSCLLGSMRAVFSVRLTLILASMWVGSTVAGHLHTRFGRPSEALRLER